MDALDPRLLQRPDADPAETAEWLEALRSVVQAQGAERGFHLIQKLHDGGYPCIRRKPLPDGEDLFEFTEVERG